MTFEKMLEETIFSYLNNSGRYK